MNPSAPYQDQPAGEEYFPPPPPSSGVAQGHTVPLNEEHAPPLPNRPHHDLPQAPHADLSTTNPGSSYPPPPPRRSVQGQPYDPSTYSAGQQSGFIPQPPPQRIGHNFGDDDPSNPVHYIRDPHKVCPRTKSPNRNIRHRRLAFRREMQQNNTPASP